MAGARPQGPGVEFVGASYDEPGVVAENVHRYEAGVTFRSAPCLEIYLSDARTVPAAELVTELCIPVEDTR